MNAPLRGLTVLLLHAFPLDTRMWDETRSELGELAVVAPTLPPEGDGRTLSGWATAVLGLVGVSMGGYLAYELWRQAPERISGLVLSDTRARPETDEGRVGRERTIELIHAHGAAGLWREMEPKLFSPAAEPEVVAQAQSIALERSPSDLITSVEAIRDRADSRPTLATIDVPTLVVVGEKDELTPPHEAAAIASGIAGSKLVTIPDSGHLPPLERPRAFRSSLRALLAEVGA